MFLRTENINANPTIQPEMFVFKFRVNVFKWDKSLKSGNPYIEATGSRFLSGDGDRDLEDTEDDEDEDEDDLFFAGDLDLCRSTSSSLESEE